MAAVLDHVRPLAALLRQAHDPAGLADELVDVAAAATDGDGSAVASLISEAVTDRFLVRPTLVHCGVLTDRGRLEPLGIVRLGQMAALLESEAESGFRLVLTVPGFLRPPLEQFVKRHGDTAQPLATTTAIRETAAAAGPKLQIAAPYMHTGFVRLLAPQVDEVPPAFRTADPLGSPAGRTGGICQRDTGNTRRSSVKRSSGWSSTHHGQLLR